MRRRTLCVIGLLALILPYSAFVPTHAQTSDAPYIYYYSDEINAFIVERADGTDTRVLGAGLMPPLYPGDGVYVSGPGWSPSGKWFAWQFAQVGAYGLGENSLVPYAIKADGSRRLTLLDGMKNVQMAWAPHSDLLFIASQYYEASAEPQANDISHGYLHTDFYLVDVNADRVLSSEKENVYEPNVFSDIPAPVIAWIDDTHVIAEFASLPYQEQLGSLTTYFRIFDTHGSAIEKTIANILSNSDASFELGAVSSQGTVIYRMNGGFIGENLITGERQSLGKAPESSLTIQWSPDGNRAILIGSSLYFLSLDTFKLVSILSPYVPPISTFDWPILSWSPDSSHVLFVSGNWIYHFSAADGNLEELPSPSDPKNCDCISWVWKNKSQALIYWLDNGRAEEIMSVYFDDFSVKSHIFAEIPNTVSWSYDQPDITSDERYIAYMDFGLVIYDIQTHAKMALSPAARSFNAAGSGEVAWHSPDNQWMLTFQNGTISSGGNCCRYIGIARADGSVERDLTFVTTPITSTAADWLPSQVSLENLPSPLTKPLYPNPTKTFKGNDWSIELSWSPDGKQLLSAVGARGDEAVVQWDLATSNVTPVFATVAENQHLGWKQSPDGNFSPQLVVKPTKTSNNLDLSILAVSPDSRQFAAYDTKSYSTGVYDSTTGNLIQQVGDLYRAFTSASYSPDGRLLAIGDIYEPTQIWDTQTWQVVATLRYPAPAVAFSPDGKWLAASRSWDIDLWSVHDLLAWGKPVF